MTGISAALHRLCALALCAGFAGAPVAAQQTEAMLGYSYGGGLHAGPGAEFPEIARLRNGDRLHIREDTGVVAGNFRWFRVTTDAGEGFHWGGLFCSAGAAPVSGVLTGCERPATPLTLFSCDLDGHTASVVSDGRVVTYQFGEGRSVTKQLRGDANPFMVFWMPEAVGKRQSQLRFADAGWSYILFSIAAEGARDAVASAGLVVMADQKVLLDVPCRNQARFARAFPYRLLPADDAGHLVAR